jgi:hypothetical protein
VSDRKAQSAKRNPEYEIVIEREGGLPSSFFIDRRFITQSKLITFSNCMTSLSGPPALVRVNQSPSHFGLEVIFNASKYNLEL